MVEIAVFGGRAQHFFDLGGVLDDWLASAALVVRPLPDLRLDLDYRFQHEVVASGRSLANHAYGLRLRWRWRDVIHLSAQVRGVDAAVARAGLYLGVVSSPQDLGFDLRFDVQPMRLHELNDDDDPFTAMLGPSLRHLRGVADLWKGFQTGAGHYALHFGWAGRILLGEQPTAFNRTFHRVYVRAEGHDVGVKGLFASVVGEYHFDAAGVGRDPPGELAVGGAIGYDGARVRVEAGTAWQRFKYRYLQEAEEIDSVRSGWLDLRVRPVQWLDLRARYEFERYARDVHTVTVGLAQRL